MAIKDVVRRGYSATIAKVVLRGYQSLELPGGIVVSARGSSTTFTARGSSR